jgi:hypothetical protein
LPADFGKGFGRETRFGVCCRRMRARNIGGGAP